MKKTFEEIMEIVKKDLPEKQLIPKTFGVKGTINFSINFDGQNLVVDFEPTEETKLVNLFGAMRHAESVRAYMETPEGKHQFTASEKQGAIKTAYTLGKMVETFGNMVYKKMLKNVMAQDTEKK